MGTLPWQHSKIMTMGKLCLCDSYESENSRNRSKYKTYIKMIPSSKYFMYFDKCHNVLVNQNLRLISMSVKFST